jgi:hypothetical protein
MRPWVCDRLAYVLECVRAGVAVRYDELRGASPDLERQFLHFVWSDWTEFEGQCLAQTPITSADIIAVVEELLRGPVAYAKVGAMFACYNLGIVVQNIEVFRSGATDRDARVRDASAYGLGCSTDESDELRLWGLLEDEDGDVCLSAAYSLRDMRRPISEERYRRALRHLRHHSTLFLAERAVRDPRLLEWTRVTLARKWKGMKAVGWDKWFQEYPALLGFVEK